MRDRIDMAKMPILTTNNARSGIAYSMLSILVGAFLLAVAVWIILRGVNFPYTRLLAYSGVAAMFAGIGSTAAVSLGMESAGQAGTAGGAAAIAVILCWAIGIDPPPRLSMTYYINFPDMNVERLPNHFQATVEVIRAGRTSPEEPRTVPILRAPGGNVLKVTVVDISSEDSIIVRLHSARENKTWASAAILPTESFMNLNEESN
jgi:hypothetical protein